MSIAITTWWLRSARCSRSSSFRWRADAFQSIARGSRPGRYSRSESNSVPSPRCACTLLPARNSRALMKRSAAWRTPRTLGTTGTRLPSGPAVDEPQQAERARPAQPGRAHPRLAAPEGHERHLQQRRLAAARQDGLDRLWCAGPRRGRTAPRRRWRARPAAASNRRRSASRSPMNRRVGDDRLQAQVACAHREGGVHRRGAQGRAGRGRPQRPQARADERRQQRQRDAGGERHHQAPGGQDHRGAGTSSTICWSTTGVVTPSISEPGTSTSRCAQCRAPPAASRRRGSRSRVRPGRPAPARPRRACWPRAATRRTGGSACWRVARTSPTT